MGLYQRTSGGGNAPDRRILEAHNGVHLDDGYSEEMEYKAAELSEDMTVFPAEGSIVEEKIWWSSSCLKLRNARQWTGGKTCTDNKSMVNDERFCRP